MAAIKLAIAIDANNPVIGDIYIDPTTGSDRMCATLLEEVQQSIITRFFFFQGEWFLDPTAGVPWYQSILGVKNSDANVSAILQRVITTTPGVQSLLSFSLNRSGRTISPKFACQLADGTTLTSADFGPMVIGS